MIAMWPQSVAVMDRQDTFTDTFTRISMKVACQSTDCSMFKVNLCENSLCVYCLVGQNRLTLSPIKTHCSRVITGGFFCVQIC